MNSNLHIQQLVGAFQQRQYESVIQAVNSAPALLNQEPIVVQVYAGALRRTEQSEAAKLALQKGLKRFKKHPDLLNSLGNLYLEAGRSADAVAAFKQAASLAPANMDIQYNYGRALKERGQWSQAEKVLKTLIRVQPGNVNARILLADIAAKEKRREDAASLLNEALTIQPDNITGLNNLANVYRSTGQLESAHSLLEKAVSLQPGNSVLLRNLAACKVLLQRKDEARQIYQQAISANPDDWQAQEEYASFLWAEDDASPFATIEQYLGKAAERASFWLAYISLLIKVEDYSRALALISEVEASQQQSAEILTVKARILRELHHYDKALESATEALKLSANQNVGALSESGYALLSLGRAKEALQVFEKLKKREPENQGWWTMLSTCWAMMGERYKYSQLCRYDSLVQVMPILSDEAAMHRFNDQLQAHLLTLHQNQRHPIGQSLRNGTQTYEDLFDSNEPVIRQLGESILANARRLVSGCNKNSAHPFLSRLSEELTFIGSWSVRLRTGGFHKSHYHPEGWLSGVYYVDVPDAVNTGGQGWLVFGRAEVPNQTFTGDFAIKPRAGHMVLFPSFMWHGTNPFNDEKHRMTVAFDIVPEKLSR